MPGIKKTMEEYKEGKLHSGSKHGPEVKSRAQAIAIGLSEERKEGHKVPKPHHPKGSHAKQGHMPHVEHHESNHGHPGEHLRLKEEAHRFPSHSNPDEGEKGGALTHPAEPGGQGWPGHHMGMQPKASGFGHAVHNREGKLRMSGHPGAHRIGSRKK